MAPPTLIAAWLAPLLGAATGDEFLPNHLFVSSHGTSQIVELEPGNALAPDALPPEEPDLPMGLAFGPDGNLYVSSDGSERVFVYDPNGRRIGTIGNGTTLLDPRGLAFGPDGELYVTSATSSPVYVFDTNGVLVREIGVEFGVLRAEGVAIGQDGHVFFSSQMEDTVFEFDPNGVFIRRIGEGGILDDPIGLAFGRDGTLFVASENTHQIVAFDTKGDVVAEFGASDGMDMPIGIAFGPDGRLWAASYSQSLLHAFEIEDSKSVSHFSVPVPLEPTFLAFAPHRMKVQLHGTLARTGSYEDHHVEKATLTLRPGFPSVMLSLKDDPADPGDLASVFGAPVIVCSGREASAAQASKKRLFDGTQIPALAMDRGTASLGLQLVTRVDAFGSLEIEGLKGALERSSGGAIFRGRITLK